MLRALFRRIERGERGFTLIELMIVILVILILASVLLPQFSVARERARKANCVSNQRNLETAVAMWSTDNPQPIYVGGNMATVSNPNITQLTGTPNYTSLGNFIEPDDASAAGSNGSDYYLSQGSATGGTANSGAPSYGHVACAYDGVTDPWVNNYDPVGAGTGLSHVRGPAASP